MSRLCNPMQISYICASNHLYMKKVTNTIISLLSLGILLTACSIMDVRTSSSPTMVPEDVMVWTVSGVEFNNADFSGLSFSADGKSMIAAFNSAALYWMEIPRKAKNKLVFKPLEVENSGFHKVRRDIECVTLDPKTGDIWYGQERDGEYKGSSLYRLRAPRYDKDELVVSFDSKTIPDGNQGIEGLTWIGDGMYIVGREGKVLDRYPIPDIANAEALVIDRKRSCIWIGSDEEPSKLYRIRFKNL